MEEFSQKLMETLEVLEMEVQSLNAMINEMLKSVSNVKERGLQTLHEVVEWISKAEEIEKEASRLLDQSISECYNLSKYDDVSQIIPSTRDYSKTVCMTLEEVKTHISKGVFKEYVKRAPLSHVKKMLPLQPIVSREMLVEKVWKCLEGKDCRTLGLYGMAGVGKTTLLTQIKNKFIKVTDVPSLVIFVIVKSEKVEGIQDEIGKILGLYCKGSRREKASTISKFLKRKRFVLLLDGIQRKVDLEEIGVPVPSSENGCKIVFTTRSQEAQGSGWADVVEEVECLSSEESWDLFQKIVGETTLKSHPDIPELAKIVARKWGGLPIALNLIGKIMSRKTTAREWHHAIHVLLSYSVGYLDREVSILKFTYDNLPDDNIKSCFLYCALFPETCDISKQDLVDCWICEGIVEEEDREIAENKGYEIIDDLVRVGLLMESKSGYGVNLHAMVLEMALWVTSGCGKGDENFVVKCGEGINQMPAVNDWNTVRRMSVTSTQIETVLGSPLCSKLSTLFLQENENLKRISGDFFQWMTSLVVLNLSRNRELSELPEKISSLVSLQFLNLSGTWINRLPLGLKELKKLIHLDLDYTSNLKKIEVIASLSNLQVLRLFCSVPMEVSLMESLQRLTSLKELSLTVVEDSVFARLLSSHRSTSCIRRLSLRYITITDGVVSLLNAMFSLRELDILGCNIPKIPIDWRSTTQVETVYYGNIVNTPQFRNIRKMSLRACNSVRDLTWLVALPSLDDLTLYKCPQIERVISKEEEIAQLGYTREQPFQNLIRLSLNDLPELESIYGTPLSFPVLEEIIISGCPKLRRLPFNSESAKGNHIRLDLNEEWIQEVEWEDEATKQRFSNFENRDFVQMAKEQKMDDLASELHPVQNKVPVGTTKGGESATASSISGKKVLQPETHAKGVTMECTNTYRVSTLDDQISNRTHDLNEEWIQEVEWEDEATKQRFSNFENRDFVQMDSLALELHPVQNKVLVGTTKGGENATASSISGKKVLQPETHAKGVTMECTHTDKVSTLDGQISNSTDETIMAGELVSFGVQNLWNLLSQEYESFQGVEDQVTELKRDLNLLMSFLKDACAKKHTNAVVRNSVLEINEIVYDAEDVIEEFLLKEKLGKTSGILKRLRRTAFIILDRMEIAVYIKGISKRISKVICDMQSFGVQSIIVDDYMQPQRDRVREMRRTFPNSDENNLVGLEANIKKLVGYLVDEDNVQVVSITGMGGLGKTTLARQIFNHKKVKNMFDGLAWVCVSQEFTKKSVWQTILRDLKPKEDGEKILRMTEVTLQDELYGLLETSKSLIVLDDIWKEEDWALIKPIFPSGKDWKVLITSRYENVTMGGDTRYKNLKPEFLNSEDSWTLLQRIAYPKNDSSEFKINEEMEEMAKEMIKHCGGLPLAVKVLGGLLAANYTEHDWKRLSENIGYHVVIGRTNRQSGPIDHVLSLSFEELPSYLKHCFLYLAHFPEDHEIKVEDLSYCWAAEGISKPRHYDGESIRDVADGCIEELVRRNMVIAERDVMTLRFETCHLHDMMREVCLIKAKGENFLQIVGSTSSSSIADSQSGTSRRLVLHNPTTTSHVEGDLMNPKLRSLVIVWRGFSRNWMLSKLTLTRLQLMRVLDLSYARFEGGNLPSSIGKLIHLRYLSLKMAEVSHLPSSLENLKLLIYLNLDTWGYIFVPNVLMGMQELKYLALPRRMDKKTKLELSNLEKLETLMNFATKNGSIEDLRGMVRLRFLHIKLDDETSLETVSASISGMKHLEFLRIKDLYGSRSERRIEEGILLDFIHLKHLQLEKKLPKQQCFPPHLTMIELWKCCLEEDPMPILEKLPQLKEVGLLIRSFSGRRMVCSGGGFPQLQELVLEGLKEWEEWIVEEGSMSLLHTLEIKRCPKLKELPDRLQFISSLKELKIEEEWKERLSEGGADNYKVKHIPSVKFKGVDYI